jgi:hypothetical protein
MDAEAKRRIRAPATRRNVPRQQIRWRIEIDSARVHQSQVVIDLTVLNEVF